MAKDLVEYGAMSSGPVSDSVILARVQENNPDKLTKLAGAVMEQREMVTYRLDLIWAS